MRFDVKEMPVARRFAFHPLEYFNISCTTDVNITQISECRMRTFLPLSVGLLLMVGIGGHRVLAGYGPVSPFDCIDPFAPHIVLAQSVKDTIPPESQFLGGEEEGYNPFEISDNRLMETKVEYDPATDRYIVRKLVGGVEVEPPSYMTFEEYLRWKSRQDDRKYMGQLAGTSDTRTVELEVKDPAARFKVEKSLVERIFGGENMNLRLHGNLDLTLGLRYENYKNPLQDPRFQKQWFPDFRPKVQFGVTGKLGEKLNLNINFNEGTSTFNFDNFVNVNYNSHKFSEDDILQNIEFGNISLPLKSNLIRGAQGLKGIKTELKFGHLYLTLIGSQQRSQQKRITLKSGAQLREFEIRPDEYDENRHFFVSYYHRNNYERALSNLPEVTSLVKIRNIEVWITDNNPASINTDVRDIVALADLGTADPRYYHIDDPSKIAPSQPTPRDLYGTPLPFNDANRLYEILTADNTVRQRSQIVNFLQSPPLELAQTRDFEKVRARKLSPSEYTYHPDLGFISLNIRPRPNQVVAVAFEYVYRGKVYRVGEFSSEIPQDSSYNVLFVKMLKSTGQDVTLPAWNLMMKNVYSLGTYDLTDEDFKLEITYQALDGKFKRYMDELDGYPLINLFEMDHLNATGDPQPDGIFDFVPGLTVIPRTGSIIFPLLEPFGRSMKRLLHRILPNDTVRANRIYEKYGYPELYTKPITDARQYLDKNKFVIKGEFKSSVSDEISLGAFNIPRGSIRVTAGGKELTEANGDISIDYNLGKIKILKPQYLQPGVQINVSFEDNTLFGFQLKTLWGVRAEYRLSPYSHIGGTFLHLFERPYTRKVNFGDDPINNRIFGLDYAFSKEVPIITRWVDALPFVSTKAKSQLNFQAEVAALKPGHSKAIEQEGSEGGVIYIDDFEGVSASIPLTFAVQKWVLASVPQNHPEFPEGTLTNDWRVGANRARLAWYIIQLGTRAPRDNEDSYTRAVSQRELFPNRQRLNTFLIAEERIFDVTFFPNEKGPYNFDIPGGYPGYTAGIDKNNHLLQPETRWAGIMRELTTTDFQEANIEYIDFWMLSPYLPKSDGDPVSRDGKIEIHLGTLSEDILKDSRQQFENGLPTEDLDLPVEYTRWGRIARRPPLIPQSFDNEKRPNQDLGLDGLDDNGENEHFKEYIDQLRGFVDPQVFQNEIVADPANDNFVPFLSEEFTDQDNSIVRYKKYNNPQGNSEPSRVTFNNAIVSNTLQPDKEDLNNDESLNEAENYYIYEIPLIKEGDSLNLDLTPFITDIKRLNGPNNVVERWYRFRVPIHEFTKKVGQINDFRNIQFIRLIFKGFDRRTTFRFAKFDFTRNQWRIYERDKCSFAQDRKDFTLDVVNIEENDKRYPFKYVTPPGIRRERLPSSGAYADIFQNEQSLVLHITDLLDSCERSIYKIVDLDMRRYERLKMFVHAHEINSDVVDGDLKLFIQLGRDFTDNYYEYEMPLYISDPANGVEERENIWLKENELDIALQTFVELKKKRNRQGVSLVELYEMADPEKDGAVFRIKGNPTLGMTRAIRIGVRNSTEVELGDEDIEVWINELRLTGLDERGGVAAMVKSDVQLADLGNISAAAAYTGIGFGGLDQRLMQRSQEQLFQYDVSATLNLDKFFPKNWGFSIPLYMQYSRSISLPRYDPIDSDVKLREKLNEARDARQRDSIRNQAVDQITIRAINLTNVKWSPKAMTASKMPWNPRNVTISYAFSDTRKANPEIRNESNTTHNASVKYAYSIQPKYLRPFSKWVKSPHLRFIREFNFNPIPNAFVVDNAIDRRVNVRTYRFSHPNFDTWWSNLFKWKRNYQLKWNLTKSINLNLSAVMDANVDELIYNPLRFGYVDPRTDRVIDSTQRVPYLRKNLREFGRPKVYQHKVAAQYRLPFNYFPYMQWINGNVSYTAQYQWTSGSLRTMDSLGNVIQNNRNVQASIDMRFTRLYQKIPYLRSIDSPPRKKRRSRRSTGQKKTIQPQQGVDKKKGKRRKRQREPSWTERILIRPLLALRSAKLNVSQNDQTVVPGFLPRPSFLGMDRAFQSPGWNFVLGDQPRLGSERYPGWLDQLAQQGVLSSNLFQTRDVLQVRKQNLKARIVLEPFYDLKVDFNWELNRTFEHSELFNDTLPDASIDFQHLAVEQRGSYRVTYFNVRSLFEDSKALFEAFDQYRLPIAQRLAEQNGITAPHDSLPLAQLGYKEGYGPNHTKVLQLAFLSAYTNKDPNLIPLKWFPLVPLPNWNVSYNGLRSIEALKDIFSSFTIRHAYKSTVTVNTFETNLQYREDDLGRPIAKNPNTLDFYPRYRVPSVVIDQAFSPLLSIDMKTRNDFALKVEMKKSSKLALEVDYSRLNETKSTAYSLSMGYVMKNFDYKTFTKGKAAQKKRKRKSKRNQTNPFVGLIGKIPEEGRNLEMSLELAYKDNISQAHSLNEKGVSEAFRGSTEITISPALQYRWSERLTYRLFWDYRRTIPHVSNQYERISWYLGFTVRLQFR